MLFRVRNWELVKDREKTYLTSPADVSDTTLTVKAINTAAWADNDWVIIGELGSKTTEFNRLSGAVSNGTSMDINDGSGGVRFTHSIDEPVYRSDFNQIEFSRSATEDGVIKTVLATNVVQPDDVYTRYEDIIFSSGFGFVRFKNSLTGAFSAYSAPIPYTGYKPRFLGQIQKMVRRLLDEPDFEYITDDDITQEVNEKQRDVAHERLWPFYETIRSASSVANQRDYEVDDDVVVGKPHTITFDSEPLAKIDAARFDVLNWNTSVAGQPTHAGVWNNEIRLYPIPTTSADTTQLNGALSATATTITVDDNSGFSPNGRLLIDSEVISFTLLGGTTQFLGCIRGEEGTTAATHLDNATVTERDLIYTAHEEPENLVDVNDETKIPDPSVPIYGAAMELALGKMHDQVLSDRLHVKYDQALERLRDKFGRKFTSQYYRIKDRDEVVLDAGMWRNPNDYLDITGGP